MLDRSVALNLPQTLQLTYVLWKTGFDLKTGLPRSTYYKHYRQLKEHGIDIRRPFLTRHRLSTAAELAENR